MAKFPIFVFDFDGVVVDSTNECLVSSYNAWQKWNGCAEFRTSLGEFDEGYCARFRLLRPRVRGAGEYYLVHRALDEDISIPDQATYDRFVNEWQSEIRQFKDQVFRARDALRSRLPDVWLDLHVVFEDVLEFMRTCHKDGRLYIATLKDARSVEMILARNQFILEPERLFDQSRIAAKLEALEAIRRVSACSKQCILFIDDNVTHLHEPYRHGFPVWLSTWGPAVPEYLEAARKSGIPTVNSAKELENIASKFSFK